MSKTQTSTALTVEQQYATLKEAWAQAHALQCDVERVREDYRPGGVTQPGRAQDRMMLLAVYRELQDVKDAISTVIQGLDL
jgi:hypothetical protein